MRTKLKILGDRDETELNELLALLDGSVEVSDQQVRVADPIRLHEAVHRLAELSALERGQLAREARFLVRSAAQALDIYPASIHPLYMARGKGEIPPTFTVPALNLRALPFEAARAVFRTAPDIAAGAFIFEISRAEVYFTEQGPGEYATAILAAAIAEGYQGPVFIQGDHFQISPSRFKENPAEEIRALRELAAEAIQAGFYNIDLDASTLVDLDQETLAGQQRQNSQLTAELTAFIRSLEPAGITVAVGGEIGEVGGLNSTEAELRAFMAGFIDSLSVLSPGRAGLSKVSIQTGTSHGGVMLPDGHIAEVNVDFETIRRLGRIAQSEYGMGGVVQHGASTLPVGAFARFVEAGTAEIHLATSFTQTLYERLPEDLRLEMHRYLDEQMAEERLPGMTDAQFYHKTGKYALGPFKAQLWHMDQGIKSEIGRAWERQFREMFTALGLEGTRQLVETWIPPVTVQPVVEEYSSSSSGAGGSRDLAD